MKLSLSQRTKICLPPSRVPGLKVVCHPCPAPKEFLKDVILYKIWSWPYNYSLWTIILFVSLNLNFTLLPHFCTYRPSIQGIQAASLEGIFYHQERWLFQLSTISGEYWGHLLYLEDKRLSCWGTRQFISPTYLWFSMPLQPTFHMSDFTWISTFWSKHSHLPHEQS